jgi:uncharacterized protein (TIGR02569 family)
MLPSKHVITSFRARGTPQRLAGGQGTSYLVGNTVLKRAENETEVRWIAETLSRIEEKRFRAPRYLTSTTGTFIVDGWIAYEFLQGRHMKGRWKEKRRVLEDFHNALAAVSMPSFFHERCDHYSLADKMAWGELEIKCHKRLQPAVKLLTSRIKQIDLPNQIIQGDPGNILFSPCAPPAIIDFSPYWRPVEFSLAVLIVDALVWEGASESIFQVFRDVVHLDQLLLRAELRRVLELDGLSRKFGPERLEEVDAHAPTIELIRLIVDSELSF